MHASNILSPCSGVCTIAGEDTPLAGHCIGCGRSLSEIGSWRDLDDTARANLMSVLPGRLRRAGLAVPNTLKEAIAP
ncbi:putative Fe-S protein YdhL (DUF1289 family) [Neorhizobium huautlense]|uniref:Fe-S protein YdhL (DUF1289 family) n=1 Tax=Neorhizobium huautlense TaxID=67774 RepID=A0ABT9Q2K7_9HYPH|nr:DUF1289 domain-containing protein [Neorhizobium huautlense]MDP9840558.1 putative Fe-S protein YdhL (DUF1289 family) [Neorhizobium huautlense]